MSQKLTILFFFISILVIAQEQGINSGSRFELTPEFMMGISAEANENFPERKMQTSYLLNFGWDHKHNSSEWAHRLKGLKTGISISYTNFGNNDSIGSSYTLLPFIEFNALGKEKLSILAGMGGSYFTKKYDSITNFNNQAITTDVVWSFRLFMYYRFYQGKQLDWRAGVGYFHHSNGHTRLPNQGFNSFLFSLSADIKRKEEEDIHDAFFENSRHYYFSARMGYGANVLAKVFNDKKDVFTLNAEFGKAYNNTYQLGIGVYYRYYKHYYDYIKDDEFLVRDGEEFDYFKKDPWLYASNFGVFGSAEVLLNHIGIDAQIGFNVHKPAYKIDWRINEGWTYIPREIPPNAVLGEFDTKFWFKHHFSTRMGMKYYLIGNDRNPNNNLFLGFHINANLGQADFTEFSLGYVYHIRKKSKD